MTKLVSIIVSVYNKENFLNQCIESLINLEIDKDRIEAIFVDDCSTDRSVEMVKSYEKDYDFIRLIQLPENTGSPAEPRNVGIQEAQGKYITLLDADDWLDTEGFPKVVEKVNTDDADFGIGQSFKHTSKGVGYHGKFTNYKDESHLKPQDIEKIFRAVGPPGKLFKRSLVVDNDIQFEHMKYGEDKLFFFQLFSKVNDITMTTIPMYHVNRYDDNVSLIKQTSMLEKARLNLEILNRTCDMEMSSELKRMALSRVLEMDYIARFLRTRTFVKSPDKPAFYEIFDEVERKMSECGFEVKALITDPIFEILHTFYHQANEEEFINFVSDVVYKRWKFTIQDGKIYRNLTRSYELFEPLAVDCYPVYEGTHVIDGEKYEVIRVFKADNVTIQALKAVEINNVPNETELPFEYKDGRIYVSHEAFKKLDTVDVNLSVEYGKGEFSLVYASYPSFNDLYQMKRQNFKVELMNKEKAQQKVDLSDKYFTKVPGPLMTLKKVKRYEDIAFKAPIETVEAGTRVEAVDIQHTSKGTPRLVLQDGSILTANKDFVALIDTSNLDQYITDVPQKVKISKTCKLYDTRTFKGEAVQTLKVGKKLTIKDIIYTKNSTPRLVTQDGLFLTANKDFVEVVK